MSLIEINPTESNVFRQCPFEKDKRTSGNRVCEQNTMNMDTAEQSYSGLWFTFCLSWPRDLHRRSCRHLSTVLRRRTIVLDFVKMWLKGNRLHNSERRATTNLSSQIIRDLSIVSRRTTEKFLSRLWRSPSADLWLVLLSSQKDRKDSGRTGSRSTTTFRDRIFHRIIEGFDTILFANRTISAWKQSIPPFGTVLSASKIVLVVRTIGQ